MSELEYRARAAATWAALAVGLVAFSFIDAMRVSALWMVPIVVTTWLGARGLALLWFRSGP